MEAEYFSGWRRGGREYLGNECIITRFLVHSGKFTSRAKAVVSKTAELTTAKIPKTASSGEATNTCAVKISIINTSTTSSKTKIKV